VHAPLVLIVEPAAAHAVPEVQRALTELGLEHRLVQAGAPGDATRWTRASLLAGERFLVAVGSDDVVHEVVNGMFDDGRPIGGNPLLGVIPAGLDNEFFRQFGLPMDAEQASAHLAGDNSYAVDVGRVRCVGPDGLEHTRLFVNVAEAGLGADMIERAGRWPSGMGRGRRFLGFWSALVRTRRARVHVEAAKQTYDGDAYHVVVGNGRYGTGGFRVSPRSFPGDGVLEVLVHHGPKSQAFTSLPKAIRGEQVPSPNIAELRGNRVRIEAEPPLRLAVDGRVIGRTPASFDVLPRAVLLKI
jgi:diacylglycerol kinase (ATP)